MCHFITVVLPKAADHGELDAIARAHGKELRPLSNSSIEAQIGPDEDYFITTVGHCDCGTSLGALTLATVSAPDVSTQEKRLQKKGWSKARIARALAQKQDALLAVDDSADVMSWIEFIMSVLDSGKTTHPGLLLHMYSGSIESPIDLEGRETVHIDNLTSEFLGHMKEDVLYVFRP